ncbi:hypothetical protein Rhal01_01296 [Rubritalea halochordaticola]|uniref:Uncharacterized protein n=2 Tax=Rubritalea halochordaticola TaxID=714537 RepID=A0ABP9V0I9_9BACT
MLFDATKQNTRAHPSSDMPAVFHISRLLLLAIIGGILSSTCTLTSCNNRSQEEPVRLQVSRTGNNTRIRITGQRSFSLIVTDTTTGHEIYRSKESTSTHSFEIPYQASQDEHIGLDTEMLLIMNETYRVNNLEFQTSL